MSFRRTTAKGAGIVATGNRGKTVGSLRTASPGAHRSTRDSLGRPMVYALAFIASIIAPAFALLVAVAAGYFTARRLGIPEFRPFRRGAPEARSRRFVVRTVSVIAAFALCFVMGALSAKVAGTSHSTMFVDVHGGPAEAAGIRDGDRIVSLDGKAHDDFEAFRADIQASTGPRTIVFERNGERMTRVVDPMPERRIGVSSRTEVRPSTLGEAIERGFVISFSPFLYFRETKVELAGPVGIVKAAARAAPSPLGIALGAGALYAAYVWPALVLLHLVDVLVLRFGRNSG
jgi:hypothetical protein